MPDSDEPKRPLLGNILRLAKATSRGVEARDQAASVRRCRACDAARPADAPLDVCQYCGARFENVAAERDGQDGGEAE